MAHAKYFGCKLEGCQRKHNCKGFCKKHFHDYYRGRRDIEGNPLNGYVPKKATPKCRYPDCPSVGTKRNSLRRGLCNRHRKWAEKGIIEWEDCTILRPDRIPKDPPKPTMVVADGVQYVFKNKCKMDKCLKESRRNGFCGGHSSAYRDGFIDFEGKELKRTRYYDYDRDKCKVEGCNFKTKRLVKGFCLYHYNNPYTKGLIDINGLPTGKIIPDRRFKNGNGNTEDNESNSAMG